MCFIAFRIYFPPLLTL